MISYQDLKFPLRPVIRMALGSGSNITDTDDVLYIPYNYLVSATFKAAGQDGGCGGSMELIDPDLGKITKFLSDVRFGGNDAIRVQWGWQDSSGQQKLAPAWNAKLTKIGLNFQNGRIKYDIDIIGPTIIYMLREIKVSPDMTRPKKRMQIIKDIIDGYNSAVWDREKIECEFVPPFEDMLKSETDSAIEHYDGSHKMVLDAVMELLKGVVLNNDETDYIRIFAFQNKGGKPKLSIRSVKAMGGHTLLDTMWGGNYVYNNDPNTNIVSMDLQLNNWISFFW